MKLTAQGINDRIKNAEDRIKLLQGKVSDVATVESLSVAKYDLEILQLLKKMARLLLEARDALPAISMTSARLRSLDLTLADRIEEALIPWRDGNE